jgi:hypothetical protein
MLTVALKPGALTHGNKRLAQERVEIWAKISLQFLKFWNQKGDLWEMLGFKFYLAINQEINFVFWWRVVRFFWN